MYILSILTFLTFSILSRADQNEVSTTTLRSCTTELGTTSRAVVYSTTDKTVTDPVTVSKTVYTDDAVPAPPVIVTKTQQSTATETVTGSSTADTLSTTKTVFVTTTETVTKKPTTTTKTKFGTTTITRTTHVPTTSGFRNIEDTAHLLPREIERDLGNVNANYGIGRRVPAAQNAFSKSQYPQAVICSLTAVVKPTTTLTTTRGRTVIDPAQTSTKLKTQILTSTSTINTHSFSATTTITTTSTITNTVTDKPTLTSTTTDYTETKTQTATVLAACNQSNIFPASVEGFYIDSLEFPSDKDTIFYTNTSSDYDCCATCINSPNCAASGYDPKNNKCYVALTVSGTCPAQRSNKGSAGTTASNKHPVRLSNGYCGEVRVG